MLLGIVQRDHIDTLTDELSEIFDGPHLARRVTALVDTGALFTARCGRLVLSSLRGSARHR